MTIGTFDLEVVPSFPADVVATGGVKVTSVAGRFTFTLDYPMLVDNAGIADASRYTLAVWSLDNARYEEARVDQIIAQAFGEGYTPRGDANYTILNTDRTVALTATLTAPRTWTLPAASSVPAGRSIVVQDEAGGINGVNILTIAPTGADTISGVASSTVAQPFAAVSFRSNGTNRWTSIARARGVELALGSPTLPSLSFTGDPNTGIYSPTADQVGVTVGGGAVAIFSSLAGVTLTNATVNNNLIVNTLASVNALSVSNNATITGKTLTAASAAGGAGLNLAPGVAPTSPVNGDMWATTASVFARINGVTQKLYQQIGLTTFTASGTFTTPADSTTATVYRYRIQGGGGGGGGGVANTGAGGGQAGAYAEGTFTGVAPSTGITVTIGAAGTAGAGTGTAGGAGGATSIGSPVSVTCNGGAGGAGSAGAAGTSSAGGIGAGAIGAGTPAIAVVGQPGMNGIAFGASAAAAGGIGGSSRLGGGGNQGCYGGPGGAGSAATGYGAGGGGGAGGGAGGAGTAGIVIIEQVN